VTVKYWAQARRSVGVSDEVLDLPGPATVRDLVQALCGKHGPALERLLLAAEGHVQPNVLLFTAEGDQALTPVAPLRDGDEVNILPPMAGG
jgi:molybdopterin converting factor small subunit